MTTSNSRTPNGSQRVAMVTGAGSGIGRTAAQAFSAQGWKVAAIDIDSDGLEVTAKHSPSIVPIEADITGDAGALLEQVSSKVGIPHRVMNNAGICRTGTAVDMAWEDIAAVFEINTFAAIRITQAAVPMMQSNGGGQLINVASLAGFLPTPQLAIYAASKAALVAYSDVLFRELAGSSVAVCCACPPVVETPMVDGIRASAPTALGGQRGIHPMQVIAAIEVALAEGELLAFPGQARTAWRMKRFAPWFLDRQLNRLQPGSAR